MYKLLDVGYHDPAALFVHGRLGTARLKRGVRKRFREETRHTT